MDDFAFEDLTGHEVIALTPDFFMALRFSELAYRGGVGLLADLAKRPPRTPADVHRMPGRRHPHLTTRFAGSGCAPGTDEGDHRCVATRGAHLRGTTLSIHSPDELVAVIPHLLRFKWTDPQAASRSEASDDRVGRGYAPAEDEGDVVRGASLEHPIEELSGGLGKRLSEHLGNTAVVKDIGEPIAAQQQNIIGKNVIVEMRIDHDPTPTAQHLGDQIGRAHV